VVGLSNHFNGVLRALLYASCAAYTLCLVHHMNFFELALYGVCGANLGAKRATYASLGVYIGLLAHAGEKVLNGLRRAHRGTKSTVRAKAIIYACNIVFNVMHCSGHSLAQSPQAMQGFALPHTLRASAPLSFEEHLIYTLRLIGMRWMRLRGQASTHIPQAVHLS